MFSHLWVLDHQVGRHLLDVGAVVVEHELIRRLQELGFALLVFVSAAGTYLRPGGGRRNIGAAALDCGIVEAARVGV